MLMQSPSSNYPLCDITGALFTQHASHNNAGVRTGAAPLRRHVPATILLAERLRSARSRSAHLDVFSNWNFNCHQD